MSKKGPPVHPNKFAWKPNAGVKINETEVGGKFRPLSEVTGVCPRCKDQIEWKRKYGKYKPLSEPAKCQRCSKRAVRQAYHNLCTACAKEQKVCAKCSCRVDKIIGRDRTEVEAEQKMLEEAIKNARERDRRTLLRTVNKGKSNSSTSAKSVTNDGGKAGELFAAESLEEYAEFSRDNEDDDDSGDQVQTSFSGVEIMPLLPDESMAVEILEEDLDISFSRAGGKGGQNVNKVETAVRITHIPIGVAVRCPGLHCEPFDQESMNNIHM